MFDIDPDECNYCGQQHNVSQCPYVPLEPLYTEGGMDRVLSALLTQCPKAQDIVEYGTTFEDIGRPWTKTEKKMFMVDGTMPLRLHDEDS